MATAPQGPARLNAYAQLMARLGVKKYRIFRE